jgi:thioredoxin reductase (NADPH)
LVRYCSICDGYEVRNEPITVLARDDAGLQKALFIRHWTKNIKILIPKTLKLASQRICDIKNAKATVIRYTTFKLETSPAKDSIRVYVDQRKPYLSSIVYVELGCHPNDSAFRNLKNLRRTQDGFIITTSEQKTSIKGLFAIGDCVNSIGQISVAAGQAAIAAVTIHNELLG